MEPLLENVRDLMAETGTTIAEIEARVNNTVNVVDEFNMDILMRRSVWATNHVTRIRDRIRTVNIDGQEEETPLQVLATAALSLSNSPESRASEVAVSGEGAQINIDGQEEETPLQTLARAALSLSNSPESRVSEVAEPGESAQISVVSGADGGVNEAVDDVVDAPADEVANGPDSDLANDLDNLLEGFNGAANDASQPEAPPVSMDYLRLFRVGLAGWNTDSWVGLLETLADRNLRYTMLPPPTPTEELWGNGSIPLRDLTARHVDNILQNMPGLKFVDFEDSLVDSPFAENVLRYYTSIAKEVAHHEAFNFIRVYGPRRDRENEDQALANHIVHRDSFETFIERVLYNAIVVLLRSVGYGQADAQPAFDFRPHILPLPTHNGLDGSMFRSGICYRPGDVGLPNFYSAIALVSANLHASRQAFIRVYLQRLEDQGLYLDSYQMDRINDEESQAISVWGQPGSPDESQPNMAFPERVAIFRDPLYARVFNATRPMVDTVDWARTLTYLIPVATRCRARVVLPRGPEDEPFFQHTGDYSLPHDLTSALDEWIRLFTRVELIQLY